jgi:hypothetical protein
MKRFWALYCAVALAICAATAQGQQLNQQNHDPSDVTGSGNTHFIPKWSAPTSLGDSSIYQGSSGEIGIKTIHPAATLDVNGTANVSETLGAGVMALPQTTGAGAGIFTIGGAPFMHACCSAAENNTFVGSGAGNLNTTGNYLTGIGFVALASETTGIYNTGVGWGALMDNTTGSFNTACGTGALYANTSGGGNTACGEGSLGANTADNNTAMGYEALQSNTTGFSNTAVGQAALASNTTGQQNTAFGYFAGTTTTDGNGNTSGSNNTFIGFNSGPGTSNRLDYAAAIGENALVSEDNALVLGGTGELDSVNVGIGTQTPAAALHIAGGAAGGNPGIYVSTPGAGMILTSPGGFCFLLSVSDGGAISAQGVTCPAPPKRSLRRERAGER